MRDKVLIANGQGFWGDSILGPLRLVREGPLHYLALDYLAEVTMSIMQKLKSRNPSAGYATDFITMLDRILPDLAEKGIKVIANAGGVNPLACMQAALDIARKKGCKGLRIGVILGDDILDRIPELLESGEGLANMDDGEPLSKVAGRITSANVYIGAGPIVECGAQCSGGNFIHWQEVEDFVRIGYPVIEAYPDGTFYVTEHEETGGLIDRRTVISQLLYEMGDPKSYLTPDCTADFASAQITDDGPNRVKISDIQGGPPPETYKVSISYHNGYKARGKLTISGPDAVEKARLCAEIVFGRLALDGVTFKEEEKMVEIIGSGVCHAGIAEKSDPPEVVLRLGVKHQDKALVNRFGMEIVPLVTSGPPGVTGFAGGRPKARDIISYWPALLHRDKVTTTTQVETV